MLQRSCKYRHLLIEPTVPHHGFRPRLCNDLSGCLRTHFSSPPGCASWATSEATFDKDFRTTYFATAHFQGPPSDQSHLGTNRVPCCPLLRGRILQCVAGPYYFGCCKTCGKVGPYTHAAAFDAQSCVFSVTSVWLLAPSRRTSALHAWVHVDPARLHSLRPASIRAPLEA